MMMNKRFILNSLDHLRFPSCSIHVFDHRRIFHSFKPVNYRIVKSFLFAPFCMRNIAENYDPFVVLVGQKGLVKDTLLRGKAATEVQETLLSDFINEHDEASPEQWKFLLHEIFKLQNGMIHETNIDGRVLEMCLQNKKLPLARSYLQFLKSIGKKFNTVMVCGFIRICYQCETLMTEDDKEKIQLFTKYLLSKYEVLDSIIGDAVVKGLVLSGLGEKAFQIVENLETTHVPSSTYVVLAAYLLENDKFQEAIDYIRRATDFNSPSHHQFYLKWIEHFKNDNRRLDDLLSFFREIDVKPQKDICDSLISAYQSFPGLLKLYGTYGHVKNSGVCSICSRTLQRLDLSDEEFRNMRSSFLQSVIVGTDIFKNTTPAELRKFIAFVEKTAPYDIVLDGLNVAYMMGTSVSHEACVNLIRNSVIHFAEQDNKILLIGRKHMKRWPNLLSTLDEFGVKYFFIDDVSEDDPFIVYSTLYSGLDAYFVTRDLLRSEKFGLSDEKERALFKRWQQSHQIFINYIAPSGRLYTKTPITFQMTVQRTATGGWHIPYFEVDSCTVIPKDEYGIHRKWLCLDRYLS